MAWWPGIGLFEGRVIGRSRRDRGQVTGAFEAGPSGAAGEQTIVTDAVEPARQGVQALAIRDGLVRSHPDHVVGYWAMAASIQVQRKGAAGVRSLYREAERGGLGAGGIVS